MPLSENRAALHLWMNGLHVGIWARGGGSGSPLFMTYCPHCPSSAMATDLSLLGK